MSKTKQLQTEVDDLKKQLEYWKGVASSYSVSNCEKLSTIARHTKELDAQKVKHNQELANLTVTLAKDAAQAMDDLRLDAEKAILRAERDTIGQAYKYMVDRLAGGQ